MDNENLKILIIEGTTRVKRKSIHAAKFITDIGNKIDGVTATLLDPIELSLPGDGNDPETKDVRYGELTKNADAFFIITPEYNHSYPGSLKRMLDSEFDNYYHKPVALAGVSSGMMGGSRAVQALLAPLRKVGMVPIVNDVYFQYSYELFSDEGVISEDKRDLYTKAVLKAYEELLWMTRTLKHGRENIS